MGKSIQKLCSKCNTIKPLINFCNNRRRPDGLQIYCRTCMKEGSRPSRLMRNFGITLEDYKKILVSQNSRCAICRRLPQKNWLAVDHDHDTGEVRGLLCPPCNRSIEWFIHYNKIADEYLEVCSG